ncbi:hypothetical protein PVAND_009982 [Polypedilum vanderplanki]|uniref:Leucine rich repeat protein n=1 Tax=Polypedilum vanderplanki TaxID=319348 RepID=A0A9J6CEE3_POLVA|nr:hypothetical protein PVAND_009982 [Polypedilum vanderplanki]
MKFIGLAILICCFSNFTVGNSVTIECNYYMDSWWQTNGNEYQCDVQNKEVFNGNRVTIEKAEGNHQSGKSDDDVKFFYLTGANLKYFPRNLENIFKNLELIYIYDSKLIEITSEDLKPFPKLKNFKLYENPIEVIREDLFINNPDLEVLYLWDNEINHIDPKALSHLNKLRAIYFNDNVCKFDKDQVETRSEVLEIIEKIEQGQCLSPKYTTTTTTTTENPLILEIKQHKQQNEQNQNEILKLKNVFNEKEQNNIKLTEEIQKFRKIIEEQEKELKKQRTQNEDLTKKNQEMKVKIKVFEAKNEEMKQNIEKILKFSEKLFDKLEKHEIKSQNDFIKLSAEQSKLSTNYESLNDQFSNFTLLAVELMEKEEELKVANIKLDQCDAKIREKSANDELEKQIDEFSKKFNDNTKNP